MVSTYSHEVWERFPHFASTYSQIGRFLFYFFLLCCFAEQNWRASNAERRIHTPKGGAQPARMNSHASETATRAEAPRESPRGHGQDYGRRPQAAWTVHCTPHRPRTLVPAPWGHADARRPCATNPGPSLVTPSTPIGSQGPFWADGQAPPFHRVTKSWQGEFNGIPSRQPRTSPRTHTVVI